MSSINLGTHPQIAFLNQIPYITAYDFLSECPWHPASGSTIEYQLSVHCASSEHTNLPECSYSYSKHPTYQILCLFSLQHYVHQLHERPWLACWVWRLRSSATTRTWLGDSSHTCPGCRGGSPEWRSVH